MKLLRQLRALFRRNQLERDMAEEMRLHLELQTEKHIAAGMEANEAYYASKRQFGGIEQVKEKCRDQRRWLWVAQFVQDFAFAVRSLLKARGFSIVAAVTLALGIGTTTAIFSVIYGVLLDPYPYAKSNEIWDPNVVDAKTGQWVGLRVSDYLELSRLPCVQSAMATGYDNVTLTGELAPEVLTSPELSATGFDFLNVTPILGRGLGPGDFLPNGDPRPVTVLSFKLWQRLFNSDSNVLGRTLALDDVPHTIVGVMPPRFGWYTNDGLWRPLSTTQLNRGVRLIVRFKPGTSPEVANQQLLAMIQAQAKKEPDRFPKDGVKAVFKNYLDVTVASGEMRTSLLLLLGAVGFLLLIACTNVANLQLARGAGRGRELAVRLALGASRGRVVRQLLTESLVLSIAGGVLGVLLSYALVHVIVTLMPDYYVPNEARVTMNGWVLAFSTVVAVSTGIVSGLVPAWQCTRPDVNEALKDGGQATGSYRSNRTRHSLAIAQVALSVLLLVGASLMALSFVQLQQFDRGFHTQNMLLLRVPLNAKRYTTFEQRTAFAREFLERVRAIPGVAHATVGQPPGFETRSAIQIAGEPKPSEEVALNYVDADYLSTYGLQLKAGRYFTPEEIAHANQVALISETAARLWKSGMDPIGRTVSVESLLGGGSNTLSAANATKEVTIVGVIGDVRGEDPTKPAPAVVFVPYTLRAPSRHVFVLRTDIDPAGVLGTVRGELRKMDAEQPMLLPFTFDELIEQQTKQPRFKMTLFSALAGIALVLAAMGIHSVLSYTVAQRTREIGLRMALGASRSDVLKFFLRLGGRLSLVGMIIGVVLSIALTRLLSSQLFNAPALDLLAFVLALALLSLAALIACYAPAKRATKVDPMIALRSE
jgi:predicted permease